MAVLFSMRRPKQGTVPKLVDLTTDEYSFVIKCPASCHLPVRRKTPPPCRGGGSKSRRGFPPTCHSARGTKRPLWPPHGEQNGHYAAARGTKRPLWPPQGEQNGIMAAARGTKRALWPPHGEQNGIMAAARRTEGALRPRGCEPPSAPSGLVPLQGGTVHSGRL